MHGVSGYSGNRKDEPIAVLRDSEAGEPQPPPPTWEPTRPQHPTRPPCPTRSPPPPPPAPQHPQPAGTAMPQLVRFRPDRLRQPELLRQLEERQRQPSSQEMDIFEQQEMSKSRP